MITATLLLAILFAAIGGYSWYTAPSLPKFDPELRTRVVEKGVSQLSPAAGWKVWFTSYLPLARQGLHEFPVENENAIRQQSTKHKFIAATMLIPAGILCAVAVIAALWRE